MFDVPLPNSSTITRARGVKLSSRYAHSFISVRKVLILCSMSSKVPRECEKKRHFLVNKLLKRACKLREKFWMFLTNSGENSVTQRDGCMSSRNKASNLSQNNKESNLFDVYGLRSKKICKAQKLALVLSDRYYDYLARPVGSSYYLKVIQRP